VQRHAVSPRRIFVKTSVAAALVWAVGFTATAGASGPLPGTFPRVVDGPSIGVRLVDVPANAADDPRAHLYIVDHVRPGTVLRRRIEISDRGAPAHIVVYPDAAVITKGSFLGANGHTTSDLTSWTSVAPRSVDLPANRNADVTISIAVPGDAPAGERYGVVWVETRSPAGTASSGTVTQVSRVGVRIYLSVGAGAAPAPDFNIESLTAQRTPNGEPVVVAAVHNTGGRALDISGTVRLSRGPAGLSAGPFPATLGTTLAIGDTEPVRTALDKQLPSGPWAAHITLHSGLVEHEAEATITFPAPGESRAVPIVSPRRWWPYPSLVAGLLALAVGCVTVIRRRSRRLRT
jgi:hypothetical protein